LPFFELAHRCDDAPADAARASDEGLLLRLESGDFAAAAPLFERYAAAIFGIGFRTLRDRGEAEDLVQDVFLHLCVKAKGFDPDRGSARTWIVQIAYRRAFDRRSYLGRRGFRAGTDLALHTNIPEKGSVDALYDRLAAEELRAGFEQLSRQQRATLEMHFFEGLDLREISARLGETLENTRHFYYRGLDRLRRLAGVPTR
jgi:RNA polymerase sigma-70 factor (ECF subfamily)